MNVGLDALAAEQFARLRGLRVGLLTHPAALSANHRTAAELFAAHTNLVALFGPEHGLTGEAQDLIPVATAAPRRFSLYGDTFASLKPTPAMLAGLDVLAIDLQDVGSRYYTFQATMLYCMEACAEVGVPVLVLDRPNPLGPAVEGPTIRPGFASFVGPHPIPTRHGLTMGGLARLYRNERVPHCALEVIACEGVLAEFAVPPSPNMPSVRTAAVYPGMCLVEGTNLSEGRGTTRPFEYVGFPGADPQRLAERLREDLPGALVLPATFRPTFQKHAGHSCGGVLLGNLMQPVRAGLAVIAAFRAELGDRFRWRTERYEFVSDVPAIDLLFGGDRERLALEAGVPWREIAAAWEPEERAFLFRRSAFGAGPP